MSGETERNPPPPRAPATSYACSCAVAQVDQDLGPGHPPRGSDEASGLAGIVALIWSLLRWP